MTMGNVKEIIRNNNYISQLCSVTVLVQPHRSRRSFLAAAGSCLL